MKNKGAEYGLIRTPTEQIPKYKKTLNKVPKTSPPPVQSHGQYQCLHGERGCTRPSPPIHLGRPKGVDTNIQIYWYAPSNPTFYKKKWNHQGIACAVATNHMRNATQLQNNAQCTTAKCTTTTTSM
jgi:hypothetical protein